MNMGRVFAATQSRDEIAFIPYVTAGYPSLDRSLEFVQIAAESGADAIEVGLPFSDPVADGPTIQAASHEALQAGFRTRPFLTALAARRPSCPLIVMTYLNPLLALGEQAFPSSRRACDFLPSPRVRLAAAVCPTRRPTTQKTSTGSPARRPPRCKSRRLVRS